jgi:hypothetical protein
MEAAAVMHDQADSVTCWCCGNAFDEHDLSRLGSHPEVAVCGRCAQWLYRRARANAESGSRTPGVLVRRGLAAARRGVMRARLQGWPVLGPLLRRLDRHLP